MSLALRSARIASHASAARTALRINLTRWSFKPASTSRSFVSPSPARVTDSKQNFSGEASPERTESGSQNRNRTVFIKGLEQDVTLTEILQSIARTAPVGNVAAASLLPTTWTGPQLQEEQGPGPGPDSGPDSSEGTRMTGGAGITFNSRVSARNLIHLAKEKTFLVRGRTPFVGEAYRPMPDHPPTGTLCLLTRGLLLEGPAGLDGFDEPAIRRLLRADDEAMRYAGAWGDASEPVVTTDGADGSRRMEWQFFSCGSQALPFKRALRRHFDSQAPRDRVRINHLWDPCCPEHMRERPRKKKKKPKNAKAEETEEPLQARQTMEAKADEDGV